ncbi:MAG: DUF934 domain-containing protein [Bacteroidota bacterium]
MAQLIKHGALTADTWQTLALAEGETPETVALPAADTIFPLAVWQARKAEIIARGKPSGLLLQGGDRVEDVAGDLAHFAVIAVDFPKFVDGRGYSLASLLRQRYGYAGELRAVGDVLHDQLFFMQRVGFDAFALKDGKDAAGALARAFSTFGDAYQASTSQPQPYFRRRA